MRDPQSGGRVHAHLIAAVRRAIRTGPAIDTGAGAGNDASALSSALSPALSPDEWAQWHTAAHRHLLEPLIALRPPADTPADIARTLAALSRDLTGYNLLVMGQLKTVLDAMRAADVDALAFKGPVAAVDAYGALQSRSFVDVDLLIRPAQYARAEAALAALGYTAQHALGENARRLYVETYRQMPFEHSDSAARVIELHTGLMPSYLPMSEYDEGLFARARAVTIAGAQVMSLSLEDHLLLLCMHGTKEAWPHLRAIADVAGLLARHPEIDLDAARKQAQHYHATGALTLGLGLARWLARESGEDARSLSGDVQRSILGRLCSESPVSTASDEFTVVMPTLDRARDRARFAMHHLTGHTVADWDAWPFGDRMLPLTRVTRPFRLFGKYLGKLLLNRR